MASRFTSHSSARREKAARIGCRGGDDFERQRRSAHQRVGFGAVNMIIAEGCGLRNWLG
jgi:hypothetical protein